jgi:hypothetical protein
MHDDLIPTPYGLTLRVRRLAARVRRTIADDEQRLLWIQRLETPETRARLRV